MALAVAMALVACDPPAQRPGADPPAAPATSGESGASVAAQVYAAVIRQLVTKDHTFGRSPSPFEHVYVVDGAVRKAANVLTGFEPAHQPFSAPLKESITGKLENLPPVEFVTDPETVLLGRFPGEGAVRKEGVLIRLGPIRSTGGKVEVGTGLRCGEGCGQWLTYVLSRRDGSWEIAGTTGTYTIA